MSDTMVIPQKLEFFQVFGIENHNLLVLVGTKIPSYDVLHL